MREAIRRFYEDRDESLLLEIIGSENFERREFAIARYPDGKIIRNLFFENVDDLRRYLIETTPVKAYVGSVYIYEGKIPSGTSVGNLSVDYRELAFDIDLTDYNDVRKEIPGCKCRREKKSVCKHCRPLANRALVILRRISEELFGSERYKAFFSGRRGVHFRIYDDDVRKLSEAERYKLASFLQIVQPSATLEPAAVRKPVKSTSLRIIIFEETVLYRLREHTQKELFERVPTIGKNNKYKKALRLFLRERKRTFDYIRMIEEIFDKSFDEIKDLVRKYYVRIDLKALTDSKRLMKIPGSLDASTMNVVEEIPREAYETRMPGFLMKREA